MTRKNVIRLMSGEGMSLRAIGKSLGLPKSTVGDQLSENRTVDELPDKVTGLDGKERPRKRKPKPPKPQPEPEPKWQRIDFEADDLMLGTLRRGENGSTFEDVQRMRR